MGYENSLPIKCLSNIGEEKNAGFLNKVKENINQVAAMKLSPYFRVFEEEANTWEDKLNRILSLFDVWIDVQRR